MGRGLGERRRVLVSGSLSEFRSLWPSWAKSVRPTSGRPFPLVGLSVHWPGVRIRRDSKLHLWSAFLCGPGGGDRGPPEERGWELRGDEAWAAGRSEARLKDGLFRAAAVVLSNLSGDVLVVRTALFRPLPVALADLLGDPGVLKVGAGLQASLEGFEKAMGYAVVGALDLETLATAWPYLLAKCPREDLQPASLASWLFGPHSERPEEPPVNNFYLNSQLSPLQASWLSSEAQLSLDVAAVLVLRLWGWQLPSDWRHNDALGRAFHAFLLPFTTHEARACPKAHRRLARRFTRADKLRRRIADHSGGFSRATLWARPLPETAQPSAALHCPVPWEAGLSPSRAVPLILLSPRLLCQGERVLEARHGRRMYRIRVTVSGALEETEGAAGGGSPLNLDSLLGGGGEQDGARLEAALSVLLPACSERVAGAKSLAKERRLERERREWERKEEERGDVSVVLERKRSKGLRSKRAAGGGGGPVVTLVGLGDEDFRLLGAPVAGPPAKELTAEQLRDFAPTAAFPNEPPPLPKAKPLPHHLRRPAEEPVPTASQAQVSYGGFGAAQSSPQTPQAQATRGGFGLAPTKPLHRHAAKPAHSNVTYGGFGLPR